MNRTIRAIKVLDYYDGVLVFTGQDSNSRRYVGSIIDTADGIDRYLVKGATPERVSDLENGKIDLRSLLLENPYDSWYLTYDGAAPDQPLELHLQDGPLENTEFLPSEGYFLGEENPSPSNPTRNPAAPRLIENWLPINEISVEAVREGGALAGHPPVNQLHVWWARRPLIASRAAAAASLMNAEADHSRFIQAIGSTDTVVKERRRMDEIKASGQWSNVAFSNKRAFTHNLTTDEHKWFNDNLSVKTPILLDVTAGGGSIPFEAGRLGLRAIANELNPVASLILRATCEWPQRYGYSLLDDYRACSQAFQARVSQLLADVYPVESAPDYPVGDPSPPQPQNEKNSVVRAHRYAQTYLWARTTACHACRKVIPLSPNWRLDNKGTGLRVEPQTEPGSDPIGLRIVHHRDSCPDCRSTDKTCALAAQYPDRPISPGTVAGAIATCPACGSTTPRGYLAQEAQAGRMGHRLYCVIYRDSWRDLTKAGKPKKRETTRRVFAEPEERHFASDIHVADELARLRPQWDAADVLPNEEVPVGNDQRPHTYGMKQWVKMFNPRQQLAHGYCVQAFRELVDADANAGRLDDCRQAAWACIALALDKVTGRNSLLCVWDPGTNKVANTFATHDFGMKWSYAEMAITCRGLGVEWSLGDIDECLSQIIAMAGHAKPDGDASGRLLSDAAGPAVAPPARIIRGDARDLPLDDASIDCIVFDPPYEQNVCYAELSDFFYVWLKRTAGYVFPDAFTDYLTEKDQEAISSPARFRRARERAAQAQSKQRSTASLALADYQEKMAEIFAECRRVIKDNGPDQGIMTVMFNHKSTAAWESLTIALINAGFAITRTWPVKTEAESSMHIRDKAAARTTILLVCRPRSENLFPKPWHEVEDLIAQAVRDDIRDNLSKAGLKPIDLYLSAFGPALRVISEHWGTERESANPDPARSERPFEVTPTDALQVARREVSRHRAQEISREWANNPADAPTKFYILAKDATENDTLLFDEANLLARAIGVSLEKSDAAMKRIVAFKGDKVSLLNARDRLAARIIGEDIQAGSTLDIVHTAVALTDRRNTLDARQWLTQRLHDPQDNQFRATLEALIRTTKPGHDDYQAQRNLWQALYATDPPQPAAAQAQLL